MISLDLLVETYREEFDKQVAANDKSRTKRDPHRHALLEIYDMGYSNAYSRYAMEDK